MIQRKFLLQKVIVIALLAVGTVFAVPSPAQAVLSDISPNPSDTRAGGIPGGVVHLLKQETVAEVKELKLAAYYPRSTGGEGRGKEIQIRYSAIRNILRTDSSYERCAIKTTGSERLPNLNNRYIVVTIGGDRLNPTQGKRVYRIPLKNVCDGANGRSFTDRDNIANGLRGNRNNNVFFANYSLPRNMGKVDDLTRKYKVPITIEYMCDRGACRNTPSDTNSVNFVVAAERNINNPNVKVGALANDDSKGYGLRSAFFRGEVADGSAPEYGVRFALQFGVPCELEDGSVADPVTNELLLYDADVHAFGPTYMWVLENGSTIGPSRYVELHKNNGNWNGNPNRYNGRGSLDWLSARQMPSGNRGFEIIHGGSDINAGFDVNGLTPGKSYRLVVHNPFTSGKSKPVNNVFGFKVPYDAIYGEITCNYVLTPKDPEHNPVYPSGGGISVTSEITQDPEESATSDHIWQTYVIRYTSPRPRVVTINPKDKNEDVNPCSHAVIPSANRTVCRALFSDVYPDEEDGNDRRTDTYNTATPGESGDYVCFFTRIKKPTEAERHDDVWRYSNMICSRPGKQPKAQVLGHDLRVFGGVNTSLMSHEGKYYGSWGEYGVLTNGCNANGLRSNSTGSGASALDGVPTSRSDDRWHRLTFANQPPAAPPACLTDQTYGRFGDVPAFIADEYTNGLNGDSSTGTIDINSGANLYLKNIRENNTSDNERKRIFYYPNATVKITDDIRYRGTFSSTREIPRIIIIAKNIVVDRDVRRIDAWLIARTDGTVPSGNISTCDLTDYVSGANNFSQEGAPLTMNRCNRILTFNGAVMANRIFLHRTGGSTRESIGQPAEIFNLRADIFLSSLSNDSDPVAITDTVTELPPRF